MSVPVIAIFDIGKTNKKLFLFDEKYETVFEKSVQLPETLDEDGDSCEDVEALKSFVFDSLQQALRKSDFEITALNFSAYGASFVLIDRAGDVVCPLYSYLKSYPEILKKNFYAAYGGEENFSSQTASPVLGSLNSGMQLYRIKYQQPDLFSQIQYALHLPQYISFIVTGKAHSDITSIGCHTNLWDFEKNRYHEWVKKEYILEKLAPIVPSDKILPASGSSYLAGVGLHDSSAALIPYLKTFAEPFVLISSGTWNITLNPFNHEKLTAEELQNDCLCYLQYNGKPLKASRLFAGYEHDKQVNRIAGHFNRKAESFRSIHFNPEIISKLENADSKKRTLKSEEKIPAFAHMALSDFASAEEAYHQLMFDLVALQWFSTSLVIKDTAVKRIFVDGGFSKNSLFMNLLSCFFPDKEVYSASVAQASALGAALAIHSSWNKTPLPKNLIQLNYFQPTVIFNKNITDWT